MSLYKPKGINVWYVNISVPGIPRVRQSTGTADRKAAQQIHDKLKADLWSRPVLRGRTWGQAALLWCRRETRSDSELYSLAKFGRHYPDRDIAQVNRENVDEALSFCKTAGTYTRYRTMIQAILNVAKDEGWITEVPKLVVRTDKKRKPRKWVMQDQWTKLYLELPEHQRPMADFALQTGLRLGNVLGLTWDRVDLERKLVWVEAEDMKADEALAVPMNQRVVEILTTRKAAPDCHAVYVFTFRGKPIKSIKTAFKAACVRAGLGYYDREDGNKYKGLTWHGLRHTWATWHVQNQTPLDVVQKLGAWKDPRMVRNYAHHTAGYLAQFADNNLKKEK